MSEEVKENIKAYYIGSDIDKVLDYIQQKENIIKGLDNTIENLEEVVEHKDSIIKEVREYIDYYGITQEQNDDMIVRYILKGILKILDKEVKI